MNSGNSLDRWLAILTLLLLLLVTFLAVRLGQERATLAAAVPGATVDVAPSSSPTPHSPPATPLRISATATTPPEPSVTITSAEPSATVTATPTQTPTAPPSATVTSTASATATATDEPDPTATEQATPTAVPILEKPPGVTNILLLGNDVSDRQGGRTDSIILVSVNEEMKTATMLSLPRDLWVLIPGWKMNRINLALPHGHGSNYPGGGGALVKDTILYNFGIEVDYYVRIGFDGFKEVVDLLDGVDVAVSCSLEDWRLKSPELDPQVEENWEMYGLDSGIHHMHGDEALWYVRSRRTSNDFERGRRQQQVLRAILDKALDLGLVPQLPQFWQTYQEHVETDLTLPVMLRLAALAPAVRENGVQHLFLPQAARRAWTTPGGAAVQLLQAEGAAPVFAQLMRPPLLNRATRQPLTVEVVTADDVLFRLAADNLAYHGFVPRRGEGPSPAPQHTQATYFGENLKGSFDWLLAWTMDIGPGEIVLSPQDGAPSDYRVVLGYDYDPCRPQVEAPTLGR